MVLLHCVLKLSATFPYTSGLKGLFVSSGGTVQPYYKVTDITLTERQRLKMTIYQCPCDSSACHWELHPITEDCYFNGVI